MPHAIRRPLSGQQVDVKGRLTEEAELLNRVPTAAQQCLLQPHPLPQMFLWFLSTL